MKTLRASLAIILFIYSVPTILSALDIYRGKEPDLSSEWIIISVFFVLSMAFILINLLEFVKVKK
jgi:membrane protease YdiL (CAAX protease family)